MTLAPVGAVPGVSAPAADAPERRAEKIHKAAQDFESVMVKQLLKEAHVAGDEKTNGYGDMAVDALASAVEKGGGLGLAQRIERALEQKA